MAFDKRGLKFNAVPIHTDTLTCKRTTSPNECVLLCAFFRVFMCIRQSPAVGWMIHRTTTYLLLLFVYQWCWICCFCVILFVCYLWNYERQLDHKVEHRHGIYCKHFGNYCHFHPIILNQHLSSILIKYLIYALDIFLLLYLPLSIVPSRPQCTIHSTVFTLILLIGYCLIELSIE